MNDKKHVYQKRKYVQLTLWDGEVKRRKSAQELPNTPEGTLPRSAKKCSKGELVD